MTGIRIPCRGMWVGYFCRIPLTDVTLSTVTCFRYFIIFSSQTDGEQRKVGVGDEETIWAEGLYGKGSKLKFQSEPPAFQL